VKDVRSRPGAGLPSDRFPVEVRLLIRLVGRSKPGKGPELWDFEALMDEHKAAYDSAVAGAIDSIIEAPTIDGAWAALSAGIKKAMQDHVPRQERRAKRPRISTHTLELIEHRRALAEAGAIKDARELDVMVKQSAREDRTRWIDEGLQINFWEPIRALRRGRRTQTVLLHQDPDSVKKDTAGAPADVYADFLAEKQWGRAEAPEPTEPGDLHRGARPLGELPPGLPGSRQWH